MKHRLATIGLACVGALMFAAPCLAYAPPETDPRIVVTTPQGKILVALAPENAPDHVQQFLVAVDAGDFNAVNVSRVAPKFYVQAVGRRGSAQLAGQPTERLKAGNLRGALSVYDSGTAGDVPTLMFVLTRSPQLDTDYTSIGFVEAGMSILEAMADAPTVGDHQPAEAITITEIHFASFAERASLRQAEVDAASQDNGTSLLAGVFIIACAAFLAALISAFHDRLGRQRSTSLALLVALLSFFAIWVSLGGTEQGSGLVGVALFVGAIATFRLMGRFERPAPRQKTGEQSGGGPQPREFADGELHAECGVDQAERELETILRQGDAATGRLAGPGSGVRVAVQEDRRGHSEFAGHVSRDRVEVGSDDGSVTVDVADSGQPLVG
ncbi:MAG: peptidylprolyl isomerase [Ilumatobacteraceae bacterium]